MAHTEDDAAQARSRTSQPPDCRLCHTPIPALQKEIVQCFWRLPPRDIDLEDRTGYFSFYIHMCKALYLGVHCEADTLASQTHAHVIKIVDLIWSLAEAGNGVSKSKLRDMLRQSGEMSDLDSRLDASIDLALRLWLTVGIERHSPAQRWGYIVWSDSIDLLDFIRHKFVSCEKEEGQNMMLGQELNAVNLERMSGIGIAWTCCLEEHLLFDKDLRTLKVYSLNQVLQDHLKSSIDFLPKNILKETLLSLHLLFPSWDPQTERYLKRANKTCITEIAFEAPRRLFLRDFHHWQDRLALLVRESQSPPTSWRQLWADRRNPLQFYTFWFAIVILILTVVFGIISSVTACMQTRFAYLSLQLARTAANSTVTCISRPPGAAD